MCNVNLVHTGASPVGYHGDDLIVMQDIYWCDSEGTSVLVYALVGKTPYTIVCQPQAIKRRSLGKSVAWVSYAAARLFCTALQLYFANQSKRSLRANLA